MTYPEARKRLEALEIAPYRVKLLDTSLGPLVEVWLHGLRVRSGVPAAQFLSEQERANR